MLCLQQGEMGREHILYFRVQLILRIYNPCKIHELLVRKSLNQLLNEANNYNRTLFLHFFCSRNPNVKSAHNKKPWSKALGMGLVLLASEVKNSILNVGGWINPPSCEQLIIVAINEICKTFELFINVFLLWIIVQCVRMCTTHLHYPHKITHKCITFLGKFD